MTTSDFRLRTRLGEAASYRSPHVRLLAAFGLFTVVTVLWFAPLLGSFGTGLIEGPGRGGDAANTVRSEWGMRQAHSTPFTYTRDTLDGAPEGYPLTTSTAFLSPVQPVFEWAATPPLGEIAAFNLFLLLGYVLTAVAAFAFALWLGVGTLPALFMGYVVAFNGWTLDQALAGAPAFAHGWCLILLAWALVRLRQATCLRRAAVAGAAYAGCFLVAAYFGLIGGALVAAYIVTELVRSRSWRTFGALVSRVATMAGVTALPLLPAVVVFARSFSSSARQLNNPLSELVTHAADPFASYLLPSPHNPLLGRFHRVSGIFLPDKIFYVGYVTMLLAVVGLVLVWKSRGSSRVRSAGVLAAVTVPIGYVSSLPPRVHLLGLAIPTTSWFVSHITSFYRVYARFGFVVGIGLAVLAAAGLACIRRQPRGLALVAVLMAVVLVELLPGGVDVYAENSAPAYDVWLATQPRGIVAHYPMPTDSPVALQLAGREYQLTRFTGQPLFTLFGAGIGGTREEAIRLLTRYLTDPQTPSLLASEGVRYVVVHDNVYRAQAASPPPAPAALRLVRRFPGVRVYVLRRDTPRVDVDQVLEQNAAQLGAVEGLTPPTLSFGAGFESGGPNAAHALSGTGTIMLSSGDGNLRRSTITLQARAVGKARTLDVADGSGAVLQKFTIGTSSTTIQVGPLPTPPGTTQYAFRSEDHARSGPDLLVTAAAVEPLADFSVSLR